MDQAENEKRNCISMLQGEINRMSVTDSIEELEHMFAYAVTNLCRLHEVRHKQIVNEILKEKYFNGSGRE